MAELRDQRSNLKTPLTDVVRDAETLLSAAYSESLDSPSTITCSPATFGGKPCVRGTRIPVALVLRYLALNEDPVEDLGITRKDVEDCLSFAARVCDFPMVVREE